MKLLSILASFAIFASTAAYSASVDQQAKYVGEVEEVNFDGEVVHSKVFEFDAAAVGSCNFGRETIKIKSNGKYRDRLKHHGRCPYVRGYPVCELTTLITVTDRYEERIKRWDWQREYDYDEEAKSVNIKKKSRHLEDDYRKITYVFRKMKCERKRH